MEDGGGEAILHAGWEEKEEDCREEKEVRKGKAKNTGCLPNTKNTGCLPNNELSENVVFWT